MTSGQPSFSHLLAASELDAVLRRESPQDWLGQWPLLPYQSVAFAPSMIDYQHAYFRSAGWAMEDISLVLRHDGRPCGLWPLTLGQHESGARLSSAGASVQAPMFAAGLSPRTVKKVLTRAITFMQALAAQHGIYHVDVAQDANPGVGHQGASEWHQLLMATGAEPVIRHDLYADLSPPLADIRASFRKSFRPLINVGLRNWGVSVLDHKLADADTWAEFKQLHLDVAGRSTRGDDTWQHQFEAIAAGDAFLVALRDPQTHRLVGAGFFHCTRDEGLYAVGAYDRTLFDKPLGHVVQQRAIEVMKERGVRWYRIGERHFSQDKPPPNDKQVAIAAFKQGFASHMFCRFEFSMPAAKSRDTQEPAA